MICLAEVNERQLNVRRPLKSAIPLSTTTNRPAGALLIRCKTSTDYLIPGQITRWEGASKGKTDQQGWTQAIRH